jgi:hypothetical protein
MRCPFELDIATPRFSETLHEVFIQLRTMAMNTDEGTNPQAIYDKGVADRQDAYTFLLEIAQNKSSRTAKKFQKYYDILVTLGGYRELHKYYIVVTLDLFRKSHPGSVSQKGAHRSQKIVFRREIGTL